MQNYPVTILLKLRNKKQLKQKNEKKLHTRCNRTTKPRDNFH